jgi:hypothetical protein
MEKTRLRMRITKEPARSLLTEFMTWLHTRGHAGAVTDTDLIREGVIDAYLEENFAKQRWFGPEGAGTVR